MRIWVTRWLRRCARRLFDLKQRARCRRGEHRLTVVDVYGELRMVCIHCAFCYILGRVRAGSNKLRTHWPWEEL